MLWNPIATANMLPGEFIPAAKVAHGQEAVLAVLAILVWHFYNVHLKKWNWAMFKGSLSKAEMIEEHGLELEMIEAGKIRPEPTKEEKAKRMRFYVPVAAIVTLVLVAGVIFVLTFEKSSITTVPRPLGSVQAYERQTPTPVPTQPPTPTKAPTPTGQPQPTQAPASGGADTWNSSIGQIFQDTCAACHGSAAMGGLNVTTYADTMKGGTNGTIIKAGDPDGSSLVKKMAGGHAKTFSDADLAKIKAWIKAGAAEK
jgi:mono/diheme cytochrome c family protein